MAKDTAQLRAQIEDARARLADDLDRFGPVATQRLRQARRRVTVVGSVAGIGIALVVLAPILTLKLRRHRGVRSKPKCRLTRHR